jgi:hypothetical protein
MNNDLAENVFLLSGLRDKKLYAVIKVPMLSTCPANLTLPDWMHVIII